MSGREVKIVVCGCGGMADTWVRVTREAPGARIVGLVDLRREAALAMAQRHELPASIVFDSLKRAIAATKPDAVFDVTVPAAHHAVTIEALRAGCHVLGEKPMSDTLARARKMVQTARQSGRHYAVTQTRRADPNILGLIQLLRGGALGDIQEIHSDFYIGARFGGFRAEMEYPLILDMAIHTFDAARQITGADPVSVYCHAWNPRRSWYKGDASACAIFEMTGGLVYTYRGSWTNEGHQTSWNADWRVVGARGTARWDGQENISAQVVKDENDNGFFRAMEDLPVPRVTLEHTGHAYLIRQFIDCLRREGPGKLECPCQDNIKSLAMVLAAVKSARTGRRVKVEW